MKKFFRKEFLPGILPAVLAGLVYAATLAPSVSSMDSGELAAVAHTLGIAHPTGYPLFTLLGWLVSHFPGDGRAIWKLNLFSALLCAASLFFFYRLFLNLFRFEAAVPGNKPVDRVAAAVAILALAFSRTYWLQAVSVEVYALHLLFLSLLCLTFLAALKGKSWATFSLVLGLSFTNHMTTVLLAPGFLYLFARSGAARRFASKDGVVKFAICLVCFLCGLSLYLYLPFRSAQDPLLNWGDPSSPQRLWDHVSARQFRPWMFSSLEGAFMRFGRFAVRFPGEFGYVALILAAAGLADLYRRRRTVFFFSLWLFFGCIAYSVNYAIEDVDAYFLLAYVATAIWIAYGARAFLRAPSRAARWSGAALCVAAVLFPLGLNYREADQSRNFVLEDFTRNMLQSLAPGAVILTDEESSFYFTAYYLQRVEHLRPDVALLGYRALGMPWYAEQLRATHPGIVEGSRAAIEAYAAARGRYERGEDRDEAAQAGTFVAMVRGILHESAKTRPVYLSPRAPLAYAEGFRIVPEGLALRLYRDTVPAVIAAREFFYRPLPPGDPQAARIRLAYAEGYLNQGAYRIVSGDTATGIELLRKALETEPGFAEAAAWLRRLEKP